MRTTILAFMAAIAAAASPRAADAGCGCAKPPPPRAAVRPYVGYTDQRITLFDDRLVAGATYYVQFVARDWSTDWSVGVAAIKRDLADGAPRLQVSVRVPVVSLGPAQILVYAPDRLLYTLADDQFTVAAKPVDLHDFIETVTRDSYQAGVGADGTVYIPVNVEGVTGATFFRGVGYGVAKKFTASEVVMLNEQGFTMSLVDPASSGLFNIAPGATRDTDLLDYWRHEFGTYKRDHRQNLAHLADGDWHQDGSYHVDHNRIVVAIRGTLRDGQPLPAGATPPFRLQIFSIPMDMPARDEENSATNPPNAPAAGIGG